MACSSSDLITETDAECTGTDVVLEMDVTFPVYTIAITAFLGWFLFSVYAGVGLYAVPMDMINFYRSRVTFMNRTAREEFKETLGKRARSLHKVLREFDEKYKADHTLDKEQVQNITYILKEKDIVMSHYENFKVCNDAAEAVDYDADSGAVHCMGLLGGILASIVSLFWTIHIVLYMFWENPVYGFLNTFLVELDNIWLFFGSSMYALFAFYLMVCVIKGNTKWGLSLGVCTLHPMERGKTLMQSFLVNTLLLAMCSFSVVQFCMQAFKGYAGPNSASTAIFNVAARNLKGITHLYVNNVFVYIMLGCAFLTFFFLLCCPPARLDLNQQLYTAINEDEYSGSKRGNARITKNIEIQLEQREAASQL